MKEERFSVNITVGLLLMRENKILMIRRANTGYMDGKYAFVAGHLEKGESLKEKIKHISYDIIISSPLLRAVHTANIININNKDILVDEKLIERDPGSLSGQSLEVTDREEYWNYYSNIQYGTSENMKSLFGRVKEFLDELKNKEYESVVVVAHSGVSKAFYAYFNKIPTDGKFLNLGLKNCEIKQYIL